MPRDLTVRVRADVGAYQKAMSAAASSTDQFAQSGLRLQKVGLQISNLGDTLTKNVTLPLALAGGAAIKMATDFDKSFVQMQTLAGVSANEVGKLKESVLDLAGETGRAPQELAEALYFLQSSGLDSAAAMDALEASAKASAVGLGSTEVIADAVSSAMLAYAKAGLTAAEATDVLIATARAGKAEPAELAGQMGRLLPIASELGITFDQVGGAVAALSTKGNNAEQATTQLVNVMSKLLKPSEKAAGLLEDVGLSADGIRQMIAEKGLLGTLEELRAKLGGNFDDFLEDTQAVQGGLSLLSGDLEKTREIFDQVKESAGATENAFGKWAESMGAQNAQAFAQFQVALIRIGEVLAPIASDVLNFVSKIAEAFSNLPDGVQGAVIAFGLLAAAVGPVLSVAGRLITGIGTAIRLMDSLVLPAGTVAGSFNRSSTAATGLNSSLRGLSATLGILGAALAAAGAVELFNTEQQQQNVSRMTREFLAAGDSAAKMRDVFRTLADQGPTELVGVFAELAATNKEAAQRFIDTAEAAGVSKDILNDLQSQLDSAGAAETQMAEDTGTATGALEDQSGAIEEAASQLQGYIDKLKGLTDPVFAAQDALTGVRNAQLGLRDAELEVVTATGALNEALASGDQDAIAEATRGLEDAQNNLSDAQWGTVESAAQADSALAGLKDAVDRGDVSVDAFMSTLQNWVAQGFLTQEQADAAAVSVGALGAAADAADQKRVDIPVSVSGVEQSINDIKAIQDRINALHGRDVGIRIVGTAVGAVGGGVMRFHEGGVVPGRRGEEVAAILQAGETVLPLDARLAPAPPMTGGAQVIVLRVNGDGRLAREFAHAVRTGEIQALDGDGRRIRVA